MIDYKLLEALAYVVLEGGFERAAEKLHITQSAVSQRVKLLEEQVGQILVTRTVPPRTTRKGKRFLKHYMLVKNLEADLNLEKETDSHETFQTLSVGINADSLATWFFPAIDGFLKSHSIVLDIRVDDQDETHKMLRNGEVVGCISSEKKAVQGCRVAYVGTMNYRLCATPEFTEKYFKAGLSAEALKHAPSVIFNRKDDLQSRFFHQFFGRPATGLPVTYIPSSIEFSQAVINGFGYGMIPDLQGLDHITSGRLKDLAPDCHIKVNLYWHRWNLPSGLMDSFSKAIVKNSVIW